MARKTGETTKKDLTMPQLRRLMTVRSRFARGVVICAFLLSSGSWAAAQEYLRAPGDSIRGSGPGATRLRPALDDLVWPGDVLDVALQDRDAER